ncbi:MAG: hypothetical protein GMKNLPBB_00233 [Myxococcota bacterium]|nr:hypothetical protein [Myxococcota bacterium]
MGLGVIFTVGCLAALAGLLVSEYKNARTGVWIFKPIASTLFIATAAAHNAHASAFGRWILIGLVLSWFGDVFLIPKSKGFFLAGLSGFLLGHVAYIAAFWGLNLPPAPTAAAFLFLLAPAVFVFLWLRKTTPPEMMPPVVAYIVVISAMLSAAGIAGWEHGEWLAFSGALLFYLSDLSVARDRFVKKEFLNRAWGLPFYYGGQLILAWSTAS